MFDSQSHEPINLIVCMEMDGISGYNMGILQYQDSVIIKTLLHHALIDLNLVILIYMKRKNSII